MGRWALFRHILSLAAMLGLLLAATGKPALAVPPLPSEFWGYVTIDGVPAPDGTVVTATVNGKSFQSTTTTDNGQALYLLSVNGDDDSTPGIEGGAEGQMISFAVGGATVSQTGIWHAGTKVQLNLVRTTAQPVIVSVTPLTVTQGASATIAVTGSNTNFAAGVTQVAFGPGITVNSVSVTSPTQLTASITVAANAATGTRDVSATTGSEVASKSSAITVLSMPLAVYLPSGAGGQAGADVSIPITLPTNLTGQSIIAYSFRVVADPDVLEFTGVDKLQTLSSGWSIEERHTTAGEIQVVAYGTTDLGSGGVLLKLLARVTSNGSASTPLEFASFVFNEGTPVADPHNGSFKSSVLSIAGSVTYVGNNAPIPAVTVTLSGGGTQTVATGADGAYRLPVDASHSYSVTAGAARYQGNAISPLDAAMVARCLLGLEAMDTCPLARADVNNSKNVSPYDASLIARYAVGITSPPSAVGQWQFEPAVRSYENVLADQVNQNFSAYVRGDLTSNWGQPESAAGAAQQVVTAQMMPVSPASADGELVMLLHLDQEVPAGMLAYAFDLQYNSSILHLARVDTAGTLSSGWEVTWNEVSPGHVRVAAFTARPLSGRGDLLQIAFQSTTDSVAAMATLKMSPLAFNEGAFVADGGGILPLQQERLYLPTMRR